MTYTKDIVEVFHDVYQDPNRMELNLTDSDLEAVKSMKDRYGRTVLIGDYVKKFSKPNRRNKYILGKVVELYPINNTMKIYVDSTKKTRVISKQRVIRCEPEDLI